VLSACRVRALNHSRTRMRMRFGCAQGVTAKLKAEKTLADLRALLLECDAQGTSPDVKALITALPVPALLSKPLLARSPIPGLVAGSSLEGGKTKFLGSETSTAAYPSERVSPTPHLVSSHATATATATASALPFDRIERPPPQGHATPKKDKDGHKEAQALARVPALPLTFPPFPVEKARSASPSAAAAAVAALDAKGDTEKCGRAVAANTNTNSGPPPFLGVPTLVNPLAPTPMPMPMREAAAPARLSDKASAGPGAGAALGAGPGPGPGPGSGPSGDASLGRLGEAALRGAATAAAGPTAGPSAREHGPGFCSRDMSQVNVRNLWAYQLNTPRGPTRAGLEVFDDGDDELAPAAPPPTLAAKLVSRSGSPTDGPKSLPGLQERELLSPGERPRPARRASSRSPPASERAAATAGSANFVPPREHALNARGSSGGRSPLERAKGPKTTAASGSPDRGSVSSKSLLRATFQVGGPEEDDDSNCITYQT
jgi:hypothetical protein